VVVVSEREDAFAGVRAADAEVVHASGAADAHLAFGVEPVVAEAVVAGRVAVAGRGGLRSRAVCLPRRSSLKGAVRAAFVVVLTELIELLLEFGDRSCRWPGREPALQRLVEAFGRSCLGSGGVLGTRSSGGCRVAAGRIRTRCARR